jgi:hypothetical protein
MSEHSRTVGGSSAARLMACPGSYNLIQQAPTPPESDYAREGTFLHDIMYQIMMGDMDPSMAEGYQNDGLTCTTELFMEMVIPALDALDALTKEFGSYDYEAEARVQFPKIKGSFGTADLVAKSRSTSMIVDYKFGRGVPVSAHQNKQLMYYAAAARATEATKDLMDRKTIALVIIQPASPEPVSIYETNHAELDRFENDLVTAWEIAQQDDAHLEEGSHCRFCPAKVICPEVRKGVDLGLTKIENTPTVSELPELLAIADKLEPWIKAVREQAHATLESGKPVKGWKLVPKRATRSWLDVERATKTLTARRLKNDQIFETKLISPVKAEKLIRRLGLDWSKIAQDHVVAVSNGTTMAPEDDPRPSVAPQRGMVDLALPKTVKEEK